MSILPSPRQFSALDSVASSLSDVFLLIARLGTGWLFLTAGWSKMSNIAGTAKYLGGLGAPSPEIMAWLASLSELTIGVCFILGLATRYAAILLVVFTVVATLLAHQFWAPGQAAQATQFWKNSAILGLGLVLFWTGAGRISVDAVLNRR